MPSRNHYTERMFQICLLVEEIEKIECPVTIPPGGGLDCQQRHSPPLSLVVSASNVLSPLSPIRIRGTVSCLRDKPCLLFFFLLISAFLVAALCILHCAIYQSNVSWWVMLLGLRFTSWHFRILLLLSCWEQRFFEKKDAQHLVWNFSCFFSVWSRCCTCPFKMAKPGEEPFKGTVKTYVKLYW